MKEITCIECPVGCKIVIQGEKISGFRCKKGLTYAQNEITNPKRNITTTVKTLGFEKRRLAVRLDKEIPKELFYPVLKEIKKIKVTKKVKLNEILIKNILNSGANLITSESLEE